MSLTAGFVVRMWCSDCSYGADPQGCFDGGTELLSSDDPPYDPEVFSSLRAAVDAGHELGLEAPLHFNIEYVTDGKFDDGVEIPLAMTQDQIDAFVMPDGSGK